MASPLKGKSLCKLHKDTIRKHLDELATITRNGQYICTKCARSSESKKWLCKPTSI